MLVEAVFERKISAATARFGKGPESRQVVMDAMDTDRWDGRDRCKRTDRYA